MDGYRIEFKDGAWWLYEPDGRVEAGFDTYTEAIDYYKWYTQVWLERNKEK